MKYPRLVISGLSGDAGKTTVSLGLARALRNFLSSQTIFNLELSPQAADSGLSSHQNHLIKTFKKGPDYIDSAWLGLAAGCVNGTLDPFFSSDKELLSLFVQGAQNSIISIIEGNRGLFDGLDIEGSCSTARLACLLDAPVILILNCTKMTRTAAALVRGCKDFEPELNLAGVILNKVGTARQENIIRRSIEELVGIPVLGALPRLDKALMPERRMGLYEIGDEAEDQINEVANFIRGHIDLRTIIDTANTAPSLKAKCDTYKIELNSIFKSRPLNHELSKIFSLKRCLKHPEDKPYESLENMAEKSTPIAGETSNSEKQVSAQHTRLNASKKPCIAYIKDKIFWHYYPENFQELLNEGVDLMELSVLQKDKWPQIDGLYIGGGLPELFLKELAESTSKMHEVKKLALEGLPIYAESGGLCYLCEFLNYNGHKQAMVGIFPYTVHYVNHPIGLGYTESKVIKDNPFYPSGTEIKGHEFHYSFCKESESTELSAVQSPSLCMKKGYGIGKNIEDGFFYDGLSMNNVFASYTHIFAPAVPIWAKSFVNLCLQYKTKSR